ADYGAAMGTFQEHNRISIVIPTLDAAGELRAILAALADRPIVREIIVADGGSRDDTVRIAREAGARVVAAPRGRGSQLAARTLYEAAGGFAAIPLMEDVDLVRRLGRHRLAALPTTAYASARRYRQGGYLRRPLRNLVCLSLYFLGVPPRHIARLYG